MLRLSSPVQAEGKDSRLFADAFRYLRLTTAREKNQTWHQLNHCINSRKRRCAKASEDRALDRRARQYSVTSVLT